MGRVGTNQGNTQTKNQTQSTDLHDAYTTGTTTTQLGPPREIEEKQGKEPHQPTVYSHQPHAKFGLGTHQVDGGMDTGALIAKANGGSRDSG